MGDPPDEDLDRIIDAIASDEAVDWEAETRRRPDLEPLLGSLRVAESVSAYHRSQPLQESPHATADASMPSQWGPLKLLERIGRGGASDVFRAFDPSLKTEVALKLLRPGVGSADRLLEEARRLARVRHPNVLIIHGVDVHDGRAGIWSDRISGLTLEELLAAQGPLSAEECIRIGIELCGALAAVHRAGLIHRDVKTGNVMREHGGRIVLMDFGAGSERNGNDSVLDEDGTPLFMAPEQIRGAPATVASDMYSLGVLLFRLASRSFPVEAKSYAELRALHNRGERTSLRSLRPDLPAPFVAVVERALDTDPQRRFADAGSLERALIGASHTNDRSKDGSEKRSRALPWIAIGIALAALAIWSAFKPRTEETKAPAPAATVSDAPTSKPQTVDGPQITDVALIRERNGDEKELAAGDSVALGDGLSFRMRTLEPLNVYVLDADDEGELFILFPLSDTKPANPLPASLQRLPGMNGDRPMSWQVTSAGGRETILVIASRGKIQALQREIDRFPKASRAHPIPVSKAAIDTLRGIGGLMESPSRAGSDRLASLLDAVRSAPEHPWVWQIRLENPR